MTYAGFIDSPAFHLERDSAEDAISKEFGDSIREMGLMGLNAKNRWDG